MSDTMTEGTAKSGEKAAVMLRPFIAGSRRTDEPDYDVTQALGTTEVRLPSYQISPSGYLRGIHLLVECVGVNGAAVVAFQPDSPFIALSNISFQDTNNQPVVGPMNGYDLYVLNKYGGYAFQDDAKASPIFSTTAGAVGGGGSFTYVLYVPVEIVARDALGSQPNKSGASQFSLTVSLNTLANTYTVLPNTSATVRLRATLDSWQDPDTNDSRGNATAQDPPAVQTSQYWSKQTYTGLNGFANTRMQGIDGLLRGLLFIARDAAGARTVGDTQWPDPFTMKYENSLLFESRIRNMWRHWIARYYGYDGVADAVNGRDTGVYPIWQWMNDYGHKPGWESRFSYLPMSTASNLEISGTWGGLTNLTVLVNKIIPFPQGNVRGLTGGR